MTGDSVSRGAFDDLVIGKFGNWAIEHLAAVSITHLPNSPITQCLSNYFNAHRSGCAADALDRGLDRGCVQVGHLLLRDVLDLLQRDLADFIFIRHARSLGDAAARFNRIEAGGVFVIKVNERSLYTETTTGMISPSISF